MTSNESGNEYADIAVVFDLDGTLVDSIGDIVGAANRQLAEEVVLSGQPVAPPACLISGGETTVVVTGSGKGGRNQEFALAGATYLADSDRITLLSAGTDGTDGPTDAAGAISDGDTIERARALGLAAASHLTANASYSFFSALDDLVMTGPTGTNVMDLRLLLVS